MPKIVIVCGAGATLADAKSKTLDLRPPLDRGFFKSTRRLGYTEYDKIATYLESQFGIVVTDPREDSLERIMAALYADVQNPAVSTADAADAYRTFLRLINRRIAKATNPLRPGKKSYLYRLLHRLIHKDQIPCSDITVITFNYDLHVERTVDALSKSSTMKPYLPLMKFPHLYRLEGTRISKPPANASVFRRQKGSFAGVQVLKLHGSLNWFSVHRVKDPPPADLVRRNVQIWITPRVQVDMDMKFTEGNAKQFTFPIVVPPVVNKSAILHERLAPLWVKAHNALESAEQVIVFGYSCPSADQESANLFSRAFRANSTLSNLSIVDPSTAAFVRFEQLSKAKAINYFHDASAFLSRS